VAEERDSVVVDGQLGIDVEIFVGMNEEEAAVTAERAVGAAGVVDLGKETALMEAEKVFSLFGGIEKEEAVAPISCGTNNHKLCGRNSVNGSCSGGLTAGLMRISSPVRRVGRS
jgi:hypothetical protein